jgi:uncharacterized protein
VRFDRCCRDDGDDAGGGGATRLKFFTDGALVRVSAGVTLDGQVALCHAVREAHADMIDCLLRADAGIDVNAVQDGETPLLLAVSRSSMSTAGSWNARVVATCKRLMAAGANPLVVDSDGRSALHCAAERASTALMQLFLECGCDVHARDGNGSTPLVVLCYGHADSEARAEAVAWLVQRCGADVLLPALDERVLAAVCKRGHIALVSLLIDHGANVRALAPLQAEIEESRARPQSEARSQQR